MIQAKCPSCQSVVQGPERLAGKKVQCGQCQTIFQFPAAPAAAAPAPAPAAAPAPAPKAPAARPTAPQPVAAAQPSRSKRPKPAGKAPASKTPKSVKSNGSKKLIMFGAIGVGLIGLVILGIFVFPKMFGGSGQGAGLIPQYASGKTFAAGRIDIQSILKSDLATQLGLEKDLNEGLKDFPIKLKASDLASITFVVDEPASAKDDPQPILI